jgi:hypothetical protein
MRWKSARRTRPEAAQDRASQSSSSTSHDFPEFADVSVILCREPYDDHEPDHQRQRSEGRGRGCDQGDE